MDIKADTCSGCGHPLSESLHEDGRPDAHYQSGYAVCMGCLARETRMDEVRKDDENRKKKATEVAARHWVVLRKPD